VYRATLQQMILLMRSVIDFLNKLHNETGDFKNEKILETPLMDAIGRAKIASLSAMKEDRANLAISKFIHPDPAKPKTPKPTEAIIRYAVPKKKYDLVAEYFDMDNPKEIGLKIFDYFYEREIQE
jgi:hypothetical protein